MTESIQLHIAAEGNEVVIRQGHAEEIKPKQDISETGNIETPGNIFNARKEQFNAANSIIHVTEDSIVLDYNEDARRFEKYTGIIKTNKEAFLQWIYGIAKQATTMSPKDLAQRIKMNQRFFADRNEAIDVIHKLRNLKAKVSSDIEQASDDKGNRRSLFNKKLQANIDDIRFTVKAPLILHGGDATFQVEVMIDERDGGLSVWMESVEAIDLIDTYKKNAIETELKRFDSSLPIIRN